MDFAKTTMVVEVTVKDPLDNVHVERSSRGPLLMTSRKSPHGPREVHFFELSRIVDIVYNNFLHFQLSSMV
jgi:hypothetical protein